MESCKEPRTPYVVIDAGIVYENCRAMNEMARARGVQLRPHMKTHRTLEVGLCQLLAGAADAATQRRRLHPAFHPHIVDDAAAVLPSAPSQVVVSTFAEAKFYLEQMPAVDVLYACPLNIRPGSLEQLSSLRRRFPDQFAIIIDSKVALDALIQFSRQQGQNSDGQPNKRRRLSGVAEFLDRWAVWLLVDAGYGRAGVNPSCSSATSLALALARVHCRWIDCRGFYSHSGDSYNSLTSNGAKAAAIREIGTISEFVSSLRREHGFSDSLAVGIGATPSCAHLPDDMGCVSEIHPGNYSLYDRFQSMIQSCGEADVAVRLRTTVLGHYQSHMLVDAGAFSLSKDSGAEHAGSQGYGLVVGHPDLLVSKLSQEVAKIEVNPNASSHLALQDAFKAFPVGSIVEIVPNHSCLAVGLHQWVYVTDKNFTAPLLCKWKRCIGWE